MTFDPSTARPAEFDPTTATPEGTPPTREVLRQVVSTKPDSAAEVERLAKKYPAPYEVIERNVDDFHLFDVAEGAAARLSSAPLLENAVRRNARLGKLVHDDIEPLAKIESNFAQVAAASVGQAVLGISEGIWRTPDAAQRAVGYLASTVEKTGLPAYLNPIRGVQDVLQFISEGQLPVGPKLFSGTNDAASAVNDAQKMLTDKGTFPSAFADVQTLAQNADKALATAVKTGNAQQVAQVITDPNYWSAFLSQAVPSLYLAMKSGGSTGFMAWMEGMEQAGNAAEFEKKTGQKISDAEFTQAVAQTALVNALLEKYGLDKVLGAKGGGLKGIFKAIFAEGGTEGLQQVNSNLAALLAYDEGKSLTEGVMASVMGGMGSGGGVSTTQAASAKVQELIDKRAQQTDAANQYADHLAEQLKTAGGALLRERSPEQFRALMGEMTDGKVYVDGEVLNQLPPDVIATLPQSVQDQIATAAATGDVVEIPVADVLTVAPGTALEQTLVEHAKTDPFAMSQAEAATAGEQAQELLKQEAERVIQQASDQEAMRASSEAVRTSILSELTATGRYRLAVNEGMATWAAAFYTAYGSRMGMTPEQFYQSYRLRILGAPSSAGQTVMDQGKPGEMTVDGYHFSAAARPTLSTGFYGTQYAGSAKEEILSYPDKRVSKRLSFYFDKGTGIRPESGVGGIAHRAQLKNVYDSDADPLKLRGGSAREFESRVLNAGFSGYATRMEGTQPGQVIMLGEQMITPEVLGPRSKIDTGERVPALQAREPQWKTQASGDPAAMRARLERMQNSGAWSGYDLRVVGDELQARKKEAVFEQSRVKDMTPAVRKLLKNLTPIEQRKVTDSTAAKVIAQLKKLPPAREMAAVAFGGKAKRGWYKQSAEAISAVFQQDGPRFAALLAATSPQCSVETNLLNALNVWKNWTAAGRPTDREAIIDVMGASVQGGRGRDSVLDAWVNNSVRALTADNPADAETTRVFLSGPKVNSFFLNLIGVTDEVTNDAWMANYALVDQVMFSGSMNVLKTDPGKGSGYLAMSARTREAAAYLTKVTGETWTPAEVQETVWSWAKTLYEMQVGDMTATRALSEGLLTDDLINSTPDFSSLFNDPVYGTILKDAGYGDRLDTLGSGPERTADAVVDEGSAAGAEADAFAAEDRRRLQLQAARRLERLREQRAAGTLEQSGDLSGQAGNGEGRYSSGGLAPLEGAPNVAGASGPDARLVAVAEQYARENGIDLRRQATYVQVDPERAARIAAAYEVMPHAPQDPAVAEAYQNLIEQTLAQYRALEAAGYQFYFFDETSDPYKGNPWNAMRDLRANQTMGVFATEAGFGSSDLDVSNNPLLADTGITWPGADGQPKRVLANDLFRAVHDAFGHGMEGAGFRAQGEENAWQAHSRLFTGSALGAITSETRGQNSWLNYGPHGQANQTAKVEDTVFADQKTGLMPEWTWTEGRAPDVDPVDQMLEQTATTPRGTFNPKTLELVLNPNANLSTFFHETGHFFLEVMADIASQPNAPAQIAEDMGTFLKWAGVKDLDTWNALDLDGKRQYHERWAESIEQYVMEGKAPSVELQPLMRRFATWLKSVYGSIKQMLSAKPDAEQTPLNDDIRRVMDRMLATDEQIAQANEVAGLVPDEAADAQAAERLNKRSMADLKWSVKARDQVVAKLRKEAAAIEKDIRQQVTVEVDQTPEMRAKKALDALSVSPEYAATLAEHKAARKAAEATTRDEVKAALLAENPDAKGLVKGQLLMKNKRDIDNKVDAAMIKWDTANPTPKRPVNATDADVATIADSFGFESVDGMMQAIDAFGARKDAIDGMTEQRMLEEHGDLIDERAIQQAANEAVHNEARARSLATELRTQREMLGARTDTGETNAKGSKITVNALVEAAKQFAANVVGKTTLRDLTARAWQHTAAERRAAKRWTETTSAGKTEDAVKAKQDQMLNHAAAKAAMDAKAEAKKILDFFKRVTKGNDETVVEKGRDADIVNAARAVLAAYGVQTSTTKRADEYLEAVQKNDPETYNVIAPMIEGATRNAQPLDALTFEELQGLNEEIQALWYLAKRSRQMEVDGNLMDVEDAADEVYARLEQIGIPDTIPGETGALTRAEELARRWLQQAPALLRRVEQWAEAKDGKFGGPFLRFIFQPVKDAADRYRADRVEYRRKFQALVDNIAPIMRNQLIAAPELGYTFGRGHNGIGTAELLHAILHTGNESNKRKLLLGRGWATENPDGTLDTSKWDAFIKRMADTGVLQPAHYDFVQGVWDLMEQTKPLAQKTHRDVFGRYFAEVTADSFADPWGQARAGGYVPAVADPALVQDADLRELLETENAGMMQAFPATNRGFTKSRVEYNRPLKLDLRTLAQHIDKVLLFSHMEPAVRGAAKLLRQPKVAQPLARADPAAMGGMLKPWLNRSARQTVETPIPGDAGLNRVASTIRGRVGMALMFANVSNTLQQITGFATATLKVKPGLMLRAAAQFIRHPKKLRDSVWALSPYMADRASNEVAVLSDTMEKILIDPSVYERAEMWTRQHGYFLQTAFDNVMSPIIWSASYNQAVAEGMDDRMAVRYADGVVRQTQGSTLPEDVSRIETGPAYARLFTQFIGYFNMMVNTNATALQQIAAEQGLRKGAGKAFGVVMLGLLVPIWVAEAIANGMRGGPEDDDDDGYLDDWLAAVFGFGTIRGMLAGVPFLGAAAQSAVNRFNDQPADDKFSLSPTVSVLESAVGAPSSVYKAIVDDASAQKAVRDLSALITVATGLPAMTVARPVGYLAGVADGKIDPTSFADAARGMVTGTASPESKQK